MQLKVQNKDFFFDRARVMNAIDKGTRKALSLFGASVRKAARRDIGSPSVARPGRRPTPPRTPPAAPRARTRHPFASLRNIQFYYEKTKKNVIIGPVRFGSTIEGGKTIPELLHYGGSATVRIRPWWVRKTKGKRGAKRKITRVLMWVTDPRARPRRVVYKPRPFMTRAFDKKRGELRQVMHDLMHKR